MAEKGEDKSGSLIHSISGFKSPHGLRTSILKPPSLELLSLPFEAFGSLK